MGGQRKKEGIWNLRFLINTFEEIQTVKQNGFQLYSTIQNMSASSLIKKYKYNINLNS